MTAHGILELFAAARISIEIEGEGKLVVTPASLLTEALRHLIRDNKAALLEFLNKHEAFQERAGIIEFDGGEARESVIVTT